MRCCCISHSVMLHRGALQPLSAPTLVYTSLSLGPGTFITPPVLNTRKSCPVRTRLTLGGIHSTPLQHPQQLPSEDKADNIAEKNDENILK